MSDTSKLHILHIQKVTGIAGSENHLLTLLPGLQEYGYEPTMLVLTSCGCFRRTDARARRAY